MTTGILLLHLSIAAVVHYIHNHYAKNIYEYEITIECYDPHTVYTKR